MASGQTPSSSLAYAADYRLSLSSKSSWAGRRQFGVCVRLSMLWCRVCSDLVSIPSRVGLSHAAHARVTGTLWSIAPRLFSRLASHSRHSENAGANFLGGQRKQYLSEADSRSGIVVIVAAKIAIVLVLILILVFVSQSLVIVVLVLILILVAISLRQNIIGGAAGGSTIQRVTLVSAKARV